MKHMLRTSYAIALLSVCIYGWYLMIDDAIAAMLARQWL